MLTPKGYCTIAQIQNYLLHSIKAYFVPQVSEWIAMMETYVEQETGRVFIAESSATEKKYDGDSEIQLFLDENVEVSKITIDSTEISSDDYLTYPPNSLPITRVKFKIDTGLFFTAGEQNVLVEAKWGYSVACPNDISFATTILVVGIINFSGNMQGEVKSEKIGDYTVAYKDKKDWQDFDRAKRILEKYKLIVI